MSPKDVLHSSGAYRPAGIETRKTAHYRKLTLLLFAVCFASFPAPAPAQLTSGSITGIVTDPSNAMIPGATVTAKALDTGAVRTIRADTTGLYNLPALPPGDYELTASAPEFSAAKIHVSLSLNQVLRYDFHLQIGSNTQQITVSAEALSLNSESHEVNDIFQAHTIENLPTEDGSVFETLTSGTNISSFNNLDSNPQSVIETFKSINNSLTVGGLVYGTTSYLEDGVQNTNLMTQSANLQPPVEATQEVNVITNSGSARFEEPSVVNVTTKSGTNVFHGRAYDYIRNDTFNAIGELPTTKAPLRYNQFGANLGGPIVHNKLFFFFDYAGFRETQGTTFLEDLPTAAERSGDFSADATIYDPDTYNPTTGAISVFEDNQIAPDRISDFAKTYFQYLPLPTGSNVANINYELTANNIYSYDSYLARVDYNLSNKDSIYGAFQRSNPTTMDTAFMPQLWDHYTILSGVNSYIEETHTFNSHIVNVGRIGYNRSNTDGTFSSAGTQNFVALYGINNLDPSPQQWIPPKIALKSHSNEGNQDLPISALQNLFQYADEVNWTVGRHSIYFGGELDRIQYNGDWTIGNNGTFKYTGQYTSNHKGKLAGNDVADFLLDYPQSASAGIGTTVAQFREYNLMPYFGDDWRATHKLTVNLGLRYGYREAPSDRKGNSNVYDLPTNTNHSGTFHQTYLNVAPRLGFAYALDPNTVINGGYGIYYVSFMYYDLQTLMANPPNFISISNTNAVQTAIRSEDQFPASPPLTNQSPLTMQLNYKTPYVQQWNLALQHAFGSNWLASLTYVGSKSTHLAIWRNANQAAVPVDPINPAPIQDRRPYPWVGDLEQVATIGIANYNGVGAELQRRYANGLSLRTNIVYSKAMDDVSADQEFPEHGTDPALDYGPSRINRKYVFKFSPIYELPFGRNKRFLNNGRWYENELGGWQVSGILTVNAGFPFSVEATDNSNTGGDHDQRADQVCNGNHPRNQSFLQWFNTACYVQPATGALGDEGRYSVVGPRNTNLNLSAFKAFPFFREDSLQFRADFFSALNHPLPENPDNTITDSTYGQIIDFGGARKMQFSLKVLF